MTREEALKRLYELRDDTNAVDPADGLSALRQMKHILFKVIDTYIDDLQADDVTTNLSANKAHDN